MTEAVPLQEFQRVTKKPVVEARSFSIWLNAEERALLEQKAGDAPLGAYIKDKALTDGLVSSRKAGTIADRKAMAKALSLLGQSRLASNLNQLAKAANIGTLPLTPDVEEDLQDACAHVWEIKALLIRALGLKS